MKVGREGGNAMGELARGTEGEKQYDPVRWEEFLVHGQENACIDILFFSVFLITFLKISAFHQRMRR